MMMCKDIQSLTSPRVVKELMARHGVSFKKGLGQNFLIDRNILMKIMDAAAIDKEDFVLEIGAGIGTLTKELAGAAKQVLAIEIDSRLFPILDETLAGCYNVKLVQGDVLKLDIKQLLEQHFGEQPFKVVGNLPYYITTPVLMMFLESDLPYESMVVMVQKEVAQRMTAVAGTKDYGMLSIAVQFYTCPEIVAVVSANVFFPPPKVDSAIVLLKRRQSPPVDVQDHRLFFKVVRAAFNQRRKTIINALTALELKGISKEKLYDVLDRCSIDPRRRGEDLTIQQYADIANVLYLEGQRIDE
ncbi:16S rRNA (adenine1518-N6/adenine1519-N6)-dimethyltransferase [Caldicoprobacter guelmensis]|uniref:16S rRNA (adenine(1518)-N(6)/adenine(1519)-N(6))- dimethyltransferase RsmA n=1 Tax=Caldicoprobacter guelmensis TaxID=1170224 RepID=UPI001FAF204F|nr:16S rRNA (adenine(1518)-N(6)/adenine(1519)-N(6))-dimethyltransferase RsmA [Caldicoprobacter guelmensis]MBM7582400.1 16S rRNA (adenine1518-N6/adenine1519-N6)-dimethyltransferase [Caldicoprobacter guelmensis]